MAVVNINDLNAQPGDIAIEPTTLNIYIYDGELWIPANSFEEMKKIIEKINGESASDRYKRAMTVI